MPTDTYYSKYSDLAHLDPNQWSKLYRTLYAATDYNLLCRGYPRNRVLPGEMERKDFVQEAIVKFYLGRKWNKQVYPTYKEFLVSIIFSDIDNYFNKNRRRNTRSYEHYADSSCEDNNDQSSVDLYMGISNEFFDESFALDHIREKIRQIDDKTGSMLKVFELLMQGCKNAEIAGDLKLKLSKVRYYRNKIKTIRYLRY